MWGLIVARLRLDWRRSLATLLTVLFAVTSFVVLTGVTTTQRVETLEIAADAWRSAYDVLVRPTGTRTLLEDETRRLRPNFLSDIYGGITVDEWHQIADIPGVEVAAPIGTVGIVWGVVNIPLDLSHLVEDAGTQLIRVSIATQSRSNILPARSAYLYVTDNEFGPPEPIVFQGATINHTGPTEIVNGTVTFPCIPLLSTWRDAFSDWPRDPFDLSAWSMACVSRQNLLANGFTINLPMVIPLSVAAIDPDAEAALVGLDNAVVAGRFFTADDGLRIRPGRAGLLGQGDWPVAPTLLAANASPTDFQLAVTVDELAPQTISEFLSLDPTRPFTVGKTQQVAIIQDATPLRLLETQEIPLADIYDRFVATKYPRSDAERATAELAWETITNDGEWESLLWLWENSEIWACRLLRPGAINFSNPPSANNENDGFTVASGTGPAEGHTSATELLQGHDDLTAIARQSATNQYHAMAQCHLPPETLPWFPVPGTVAADSYRPLSILQTDIQNTFGVVGFDIVGWFDPALTAAPGVVANQVPLETYQAPTVYVADDATRELLGQDAFLPNLNPFDYLVPAPSLLIPLAAIEVVAPNLFGFSPDRVNVEAPISAIRVRVADVTGWDELSQLRIQLVADQIREQTGLDVDVTIGAALTEQPVTLTQTDNRPNLNLIELWSQLGVVAMIVNAVDRKSVLLFALILASTALTIATVASAAAAAQRKTLGILAAVGYQASRLWAFLLLQQVVLGLIAGTLGAILALPIAAALNIEISTSRTLLAIPISALLVALAACPAAISAVRHRPIALLTPPIRAQRRSIKVNSPQALGLVGLTRRPLRLVRAVCAIAIAVIAVSILMIIAYTFQGAVAGTLLGDAIVLEVRTADIIAVIILTFLGLICLVMTLRFAHLEDASDWAILSAVGWHSTLVLRAVMAQGALIGVTGGLCGLAATVAIAVPLTGGQPLQVAVPAALVALAIALISMAASLLPALALRGHPIAATLTRE